MIGKLAIALVMGAVMTNICLGDRPIDTAAVFSDPQNLGTLSDAEFETRWKTLSDDERIRLLRDANVDKAHPLRSRKSALRSVIVLTPVHVAGSESATLHRVYVEELGKLAVEVWNLKPPGEEDELARFKAIRAQLIATE